MGRVILDSESGLKTTLSVALLALLVSGAILLGVHFAGYNVVAAVRDASLNDGPEAGLISNIGILLMVCAGVVSLIGALRLTNLPLGALGIFCLIFSLDDAFLIHEQFGRWEVLIFGLYGVLLLAVLYFYWRRDARLPYPIIGCGLAFAISVGVDVVWYRLIGRLPISADTLYFLDRAGFILEDLPKFAGIFLLFCFSLGESGVLKSARAKVQTED